MKNQFQQQESLLIPNVSVNKYRHSSGFLHFNIKPNNEYLIESEQFSAVFFIKTPSHDNSGLAHAVEHLIFRRSKAYPQASSMFQLTSLSNARINASTLDGLTCFHCTSPDKASFELAVNYLIAGILSPVITEEELTQEIFDGDKSGVVYRELLGYQLNPDYLEHIQILKGDTSKHKVYCHGGVTDCLSQLTLDTITHYHQKYYQAENIQLITMTSDINALQMLLTQSIGDHCTDSGAENETRQQNNHESTKDNNIQTTKFAANTQPTVYTWWVNIGYYKHINAIAHDLSDLVTQADGKMVPVSCDTNSRHQFAIRVICYPQHIGQIQALIIAHLSSHTPTRSIPDSSNNKYPEQINQIIQFYSLYTQPKINIENGNLLEQLNVKPLSSHLAKIEQKIDRQGLGMDSDTQGSLQSKHLNMQPQHECLMIKQLLAASSSSKYTLESTTVWSTFLIVECHQSINTGILAYILKRQYQLETMSLANLVLINNSDQLLPLNTLSDLSAIITENQRCYLPNLPQVFHQLYRQLDAVNNPKRLVESSFKLMTSDQLKESEHRPAFNVNVTRWVQASDEQNWLCHIPIKNENRVTAWLASYVIGASSHFLQPRLSGTCYSIASVYCDTSKVLSFYSAFDIDVEQHLVTLSESLRFIAEDINFLNETLSLAKYKLRQIYQEKHGKFDNEVLKKLSQLTQGIHGHTRDKRGIESLLNNISSKTLAHFIKHLLD